MKYNPNSLARKTEGPVTVVKESGAGGMRKMRCPTTHQLAVPARASDGSSVFQAPGGTRYVSRPMR